MSFTNKNICKTFSIISNGTLQQLSAQECTEVDLFTTADAGTVSIYSENNSTVGFPLPKSEVYTITGITNSSELSAKGSGTVYYRTKYFSGYKLALGI